MPPVTLDQVGLRACELQPEWYRYVSDPVAHDVRFVTIWPCVYFSLMRHFPWEYETYAE